MTTCASCGAEVQPGSRFCATCGAPLAAPASEERKLATIVFADVIGSTEIGEQLDPERLRSVLGEYFGEMARVISTWGGTVEKYIGDAVVAFFGVPVAREDDAVRALRAAGEMLAALDRLNDGFESRHGIRLGIRVGVNTGEVLAPAGVESGGQFLVSGDAVNVAARLEQAAEAGTVLVGERTWSVARDAFEFGEPTELTVKGKRAPVVARRLGAVIAADQRGVRFQAPMVGRNRELETLLALLEDAVENQAPRMAVISGPAGIGKSRLLREFIARATDRHPDLTILRGRCLAAGHGITFWALGEILRAACQISLDESIESASAKLTGTLDPLLGQLNLASGEREETIDALATTANLTPPGGQLTRLGPEQVGDAIARAWPRFLAALALRSPVTVLVEDLHWADERMVMLLELLSARSAGRLALLATSRPEFLESHRDFAASGDLTVISLRPLTDAQADQLTGELLGDSDALAQLLADVRQKADGNPFFLEEILQQLIDEGAIVREDGRWLPTERAAHIQLPDTIHALLAARIDALPPSEKAVVQQAAVVGRTFWPGSLGIAGSAADALRSLERRGLVTARPTSTIAGETELMFRHGLIRDVAYASVPKSRRARAHAETARWLQHLASDRTEEFDELLAYHYSAAAAGEDADLAWADDPDQREELRRAAFAASRRAGDGARHRFAVTQAIELHRRALALAADDAERARAHEALGDDHEALFHMDEAVSEYFAAIEAGRAAGFDNVELSVLAARIAAAGQRWGAFREAPPVERMRSVVREALAGELPAALRADLLIGIGGIASYAARGSSHAPLDERDRRALPESIAAAEEGRTIAESLDDPVLMYRAYDILAMLYNHAGDYERNRLAIESEATLLDRLPSLRERVDVLVSVGVARFEAGRHREALATGEQALAMAAPLSPHERMHASFTVMLAAEALGEWRRVIELLPWHVEAAAAEADVTCPNVRGGPLLAATVLARRGEREMALRLVPVEQSLARDTLTDRAMLARYATLVGREDVAADVLDDMAGRPVRREYADGMNHFIMALEALNRHQDVAAFLPAARRLADGLALLRPIADRAEGRLQAEAGRLDQARTLLGAALGAFEGLEMPFEAAETRETLASISPPADARTLLEAALATYRRLEAAPSIERAERAMADLPDNVSLAGG